MRSGVGKGQARGGRPMVIRLPSPADPSLSAGTNSSSSPPFPYKLIIHMNAAKFTLHLVVVCLCEGVWDAYTGQFCSCHPQTWLRCKEHDEMHLSPASQGLRQRVWGKQGTIIV
jgi:hypothetical protein